MKTRKTLIKTLAICLSLTIGGCANLSGWQPTVDTYNDPNLGNLNYDIQECQQLAKQAAGAAKEIGLGIGSGALLGGAGGAVGGTFAGNPAFGAAVGAAGGALIGGATQGIRSDDRYRAAYNACLRNRGHHVL